MKRQFKVTSNEFRVKGIKELILFFLLVAIYSLLVPVVNADISSKAAIVMDSSSGRILYGKNPNLKLPPASTTKLMTAMVALDSLNPDKTVIISERAASVSPIKANFRAGEKVTVETLLQAALIKSANDAAYALAEAAAGSEDNFMERMNRKVIALGLNDTKFTNSTGLPGEGQYTTAYDLARMMRHALKYPLIKETISTRASQISTEDGRTIFLKNSNRLLWSDDSVLGGKTGYTREAKHCFVCVGEQNDDTVIVAVLGVPSREMLWKESEDLMGKGFAILNNREEPVMYFTKADYKASAEPAAYKNKSSKKQKPSYNKKEVSYKKKIVKTITKNNKDDNAQQAKKNKRLKNNTVIGIKAADGTKW